MSPGWACLFSQYERKKVYNLSSCWNHCFGQSDTKGSVSETHEGKVAQVCLCVLAHKIKKKVLLTPDPDEF